MRIREFARHSVKVTEPLVVNAYVKEREYLCSLDTDKLLAGFRETAGIPNDAEKYSGGWENEEYCGHTLGHYMVALAQIYAKERSGEIKERLEYVLSVLSRCQSENGYLFTFPEEVFDKLENGQPYKSWYIMHKLVTGLIAVYKLAGIDQALSIVKNLGEWIVDRVQKWTDRELRRVLSIADGGMNECLYELYKITGDDRYVVAAEKFDETDLFTQLSVGKNVLANKQASDTIPKILGALNRYMAFGESEVRSFEIAKNFFDMVTEGHTYVTGGNGEMMYFCEPGALAAGRNQYNSETCSVRGMMKLAAGLYSVTGDKKYMDYYERAYFNAMLGAQNPESGMATFFQPMATGYFKTFSTPDSKFWCCTGAGMELFTDLSSGIYHASGGIYVNLYISSVLEDKGLGVKLTQTVDPESYESAEFVLVTEDFKETSLYFRVPEWSGEDIEVSVNGTVTNTFVKNGYISTEGKRKSGDRIVLKFHPKVMVNKLPDMENCVALSYGPFVLAAGLGTEAMTTESMKQTKATVATKNVSVREQILLKEGVTLSEWFEHCGDNVVKKAGELTFTMHGTDADDVLVFRPYYKLYKERYGIYFEYYDQASLPEELRGVIAEQERLEEERKGTEERVTQGPELVETAEDADAEEADAEIERLRREAEEAARLLAEEAEAKEAARRQAEEAEAERQRQEAEQAELERLRREAEEAARLLAEEAEAERLRREAEEEERRKRLEAEEEETRRIENEARRAAAQSVAEAEQAAALAEAEARRLAAQNVADAECAAELAEAKLREEEAGLQAAKLAAELAEAKRKEEEESLQAATLAAELAEAKRKEEEEKLQAAKLAAEIAEAEAAAQKAEVEAARMRREAEEEEHLRLAAEEEAEARRIAAQNLADAELAAELAEAKRKEEEESLQAAKLAAERAEAEAAAQKAEAEAARMRREAEEEERLRQEEAAEAERVRLEKEAEERRKAEEAEEQKRIETEAKQIAAQKVADAEREAELAEAEARKAAAQNVADAERAAELAEAKRKEEEEKLQAAKLAAERAEVEAEAQKAEAEAEAAKTQAAEEVLKQEKAQVEAEKVQKASEKAAGKEKKKELKKWRKRQRRAYKDYGALKVILGIVGVLVLVVVLYLFATPIAKGILNGKNAVDTLFAEKVPKVAEFLKVKGHGYDMPIFKEDSVYLTEGAENYVKTKNWPQGYSASVVRIEGVQYICVEGYGLKLYYLSEVSEGASKHVYLEKGDAKAMYYRDYSFDDPASLCPKYGVFNKAGVGQYIFPATELNEMQVLDGETLKECSILLQADTMTDALNLVECQEDGRNVRIDMTSEEIPYVFWVMKKGGLNLSEGYQFVLDGIRYEVGLRSISFKAYVTSAGQYLGEVAGTLDYVAGGYVPAEVKFYAFADDDYVNKIAEAITATHYKGAEMKRVEVTGENGQRLLISEEAAKRSNGEQEE